MMGVVVNGAWPMSSSSQSFGVQNEISGGNLEKSVFVTHSSGSSPSSVSAGPWLRKMKIVKRIKRKIGLGSRGGESSPNNLPPLVFHSVHGENIELSCEGSIARRVNSFCNGITFSNRIIKINERINIKLIEISQDWRGVLRFGFTNVDPASVTKLPAYSIPNLTSKPGYWAKTFDESDTRFTGLNFKKDSILFYYVTAAGNVHFGINGDEKGVFFYGVDTRKPLWALIDVYGCTTGLEFVDTRTRLNNSRKSLQDFGGSYSGSIGSGSSGKHDGNELELKILSSMSSMSLRSDEQYHRPHHLLCHQRSVSCCQHFNGGPPHTHGRQHSKYANDDDEDLFPKSTKEKEAQQQEPAQKHVDFNSCTTTATAGSNNKKLEQHFEEDSKNLAKKEAQLYAESQLEIVCRRASLSPASFKLFNNKPSMHAHAKAAVIPGSPDLNHDKSNNHHNVNSNTNNNVFIAKGSNNNQAAAKNYNNINNQNNCTLARSVANNNVYIDGPLTPAATPLCNPGHGHVAAEPHEHAAHPHVQCTSRQRHQSMYQCNNDANGKVVTVAKIEPKSKLTNNRYSYHCATAGSGSTGDEDYLEQQLLLAASSPVSPASSGSGSAAYVVMREVRADVEPIYTELSGGSVTYSNNSTGSTYSYCLGAGQSPVIPRNNSQITPIYSTAFPSGSRSNSPRKPQTPPPPPPAHCKTLPIDTLPKQSPSQKKAAASKHQWSVGCVSCYERPVNSIFHACGHMCMCYQCAFEYWTNKEGASCPICSTVIADVVIRTPPKA